MDTNPISLPPTLSQSSLQDYVECARRYELRYLQRIIWAAPEAEPLAEHEKRMMQGAAFHRLVQQYVMGIPAERLTPLAEAQGIHTWWENFLRTGLRKLPRKRFPERMLSTPLAATQGVRLMARYDLLAVDHDAGRVTIVEWKTGKYKPSREQLTARLQTTVYRYVLALAGAHLLREEQSGDDVTVPAPLEPGQIEMVYWFAQHPDTPERFMYDATQFRADSERLAALVQEIQARQTFEKTADISRCRFCTYRSLCARGVRAGDVDEFPDDFVFDFDVPDELEA